MNPWIDSQQKNAKESEQNLPDPLIQLGGYSATTDLDVTQSTNLGDGSNHGIYGTITWPLSLPIGNDNRIWISSSLSLNPNNNPLISYVAGGLLSQGIFPGRPLDVPLGVNKNGFSQSITPNQSYEGVIELNYKIQISDRLQIQPLMQLIINPSGIGSLPTIWATGAQINFSI
ncbi:carbohydrate porin [Synechococcus sp. ROS8604]|uniref:carbohydrate porin n=1 Tax=Synechococcus sp. ROS8604 TaxID=1442557 RepID=UPI001860E29E|nr:carbohydrate porin [Synechococcus sp. ROS8604]QNI89347.1 glutamate-1-semialdehyde aminotransferase domainprotein [Synechococcus sp. ROS8604]